MQGFDTLHKFPHNSDQAPRFTQFQIINQKLLFHEFPVLSYDRPAQEINFLNGGRLPLPKYADEYPESGILHPGSSLSASSRRFQTPQAFPLKPTATLPPLTITGTFRTPSECFSMVSRLPESDSTLIYSTSFPLPAKTSRASRVKGQVSLPKINTFSVISTPFLAELTNIFCS